MFGSADFTEYDLYARPNNILVSQDSVIARSFGEAFDALLTDPRSRSFAQLRIAEGYLGSDAASGRPLMVAFGPHHSSAASLDKVTAAIRGAKQSVLFSITAGLLGGGPTARSQVLAALQAAAERTDVFSYGIAQIGAKLAVQNPDGAMSKPRPLRQLESDTSRSSTWRVSKDVSFGQKFVIVDFDTPDPWVFASSSNFRSDSATLDAHSVTLIRDPAIVTAFVVEAIRQIDHYDFRQTIAARPTRRLSSLSAAATKSSPDFWHPGLEGIEAAWWEPFYDPTDVSLRDRHLFAKQPIPAHIVSRKRVDWTSLGIPAEGLPGGRAKPKKERKVSRTEKLPSPTGRETRPPPALGALSPDKKAAAAPPPPSKSLRYTDIQIFDEHNEVQSAQRPLVADQKYMLDVAIRGKRIGLTKGETTQRGVLIEDQTAPAEMWVVITDESDIHGYHGYDGFEGGLFTFDRRFAKLTLPVEGNSVGSATFTFMARFDAVLNLTGRARIGVRLYHKFNLIDHLELSLRMEISPGALPSDENDPAIRVIFKPEGKKPLESIDAASHPRALNISITKVGRIERPEQDEYRFNFVAGKPDGRPILFGSKKIPESVLNDYVVKFRDILLGFVFGPSLTKVELKSDDRDQLLKRLSLLGTTITTQLFDYAKSPPTDFFRLGEMVRETLGETSIIQISLGDGAQDFVFPWHILTIDHYTDEEVPVDPMNIWGYRFIIEVKRVRDGADERPQPASAHSPVRVVYGRWSSFPNEKAHHQRLKEIIRTAKVAAEIVDPIVDAKKEFLAALKQGGGDLLYVYAHGQAAAPSTPAGLRFRDRARQQIADLAKFLEKNPIALSTADLEAQKMILEQFQKVTSDGAESVLTLTQSGVSLTGLLVEMPPGGPRLADAPIVILNTCESAQVWNALEGSFVSFFLDRGARAVLGSETTIPIVLAAAFGDAILESMFAGSSVGEAVQQARRVLLGKSKNPLGLCYTIYGAADARLVQPSVQA